MDDDFLGEDIRVGEIVGVFEAFLREPEDVEAGKVACPPLSAVRAQASRM